VGHLQWPVDMRIAGGAMGAKIASPIPNVEPNFFRLMNLLMCKPNKYFSANQRNCSRNL